MFGYTIIKKDRLRKLQAGYNKWSRLAQQMHWFSGFPALMKVLHYFDDSGWTPTIEQVRREYAEAMGTDEYGD